MKEEEPKTITAPNPWREKIVNQLPLDEEYKKTLLKINVVPVREGKERKLFASTPDGEREIDFTTISGTPVIAYIKEQTLSGPRIRFFPVPNLPLEEITRQGLTNKKQWGSIEELE